MKPKEIHELVEEIYDRYGSNEISKAESAVRLFIATREEAKLEEIRCCIIDVEAAIEQKH